MHIEFSALSLKYNPTGNKKRKESKPASELQLRYQAYQTACNKCSHEIAAIQNYIPGWMPKFNY